MGSNFEQFCRLTVLVGAVGAAVVLQPPVEESLDYPTAKLAAERLKAQGVPATVVSCNIGAVCIEAIKRNRWQVREILESGTIVLVNSTNPFQCLKVGENQGKADIKPESCT